MLKRTLLTSAAAFAFAGAALGIDLTPQWITTVVDGVPIRRPCFVNGDKKFAVTMDGETELTGYGGAAIFNFKPFPRAVMRLVASPLKSEVVFEGEALEKYRAAALQSLIKGAEQPALQTEEPNVMPINDWTSQRFTFAYKFTGAPMRESVTFLNLEDGQQILVQVRAREADFATVSARADDIIRRWHEVQAGTEKVGN